MTLNDMRDITSVYMDDVIVGGRTLEEHNQNLDAVLKRIIAAKLKLKLSKCEFAKTEVRYLGHLITDQGIRTDPEKVDAILRIAVPTDKTKIRRFVATVNFYKKFIKNFNDVAAPLYKLTSKRTPFIWDTVAQRAFEDLKSKLVSAPVLAGPDFAKPFDLYTDASDQSLGAVLTQAGKPIAFASRSLNTAEQKYHTSEKEALGDQALQALYLWA